MTMPIQAQQWPTTTVDWTPAYRVIPTRFPAINLFDRVASADGLGGLLLVQGSKGHHTVGKHGRRAQTVTNT